jgi:HSP20 family protein
VKDKLIVIIVAILVIALGIQAYMLFQLNDRFNQLSPQHNQASSPPITIPEAPKFNFPKWDWDDKFFKDNEWNPYEEMQRMQHEMEQLFDDSFSRFHLKTPLGSLSKTPDVDLQEKPDQYIVTLNVPGADESSLDVKLENQQLQISIKTEHTENQTDEKNGDYKYRERFVGEFHRTLTLPGPANAAQMKTDLHNGVLTITIPKA